jgi:hypothetical protein
MDAIRVRLVDLAGFSGFNGQVRWVGAPRASCEDSLVSTPPCQEGPMTTADLQCDPLFVDWSGLGDVHVAGADIVPGPSTYELQAVSDDCDDLENEDCYSDPVTIGTQKWADIGPPFGGISQPNFFDIQLVVEKFRNLDTALPKARTDLDPQVPDRKVNFVDIGRCVEAFRTFPYPFSGPCACPSAATCPTLDACGRCTP